MKKITLASIRKTAEKIGASLDMIQISRSPEDFRFEFAEDRIPAALLLENFDYYDLNGRQCPEVERLITRYNETVVKLLDALGVKYWGLLTGTGAYSYQLGSMDISTRLALENID